MGEAARIFGQLAEICNSTVASSHGESVLTGLTARRWGWGSGDGIAGHTQIIEDASDIAGELADGGRDAVAALGLDQTDGEASQSCDVLRAVTFADTAAVFIVIPVNPRRIFPRRDQRNPLPPVG